MIQVKQERFGKIIYEIPSKLIVRDSGLVMSVVNTTIDCNFDIDKEDIQILYINPTVNEINCNFWHCKNLEAFVVLPGNNDFCTDNKNVLYNKEKTILVKAPAKFDTNVFIVDKGIEKIKKHAFSGCHGLSEIVIPETVVEIGDNAFYDCCPQKPIYLHDGINYFGRCQSDNPQYLQAKFLYKNAILSYIDISNLFNKC